MSSKSNPLKWWVGLSGVALLFLNGCHSRHIEATVRNESGEPVSLLEVDYPSASFGRPSLGAHEEYKYRFKVIGEGRTRVLWTDTSHHDHTVTGPELNEKDEGLLMITISKETATWSLERKTLAKGD